MSANFSTFCLKCRQPTQACICTFFGGTTASSGTSTTYTTGTTGTSFASYNQCPLCYQAPCICGNTTNPPNYVYPNKTYPTNVCYICGHLPCVCSYKQINITYPSVTGPFPGTIYGGGFGKTFASLTPSVFLNDFLIKDVFNDSDLETANSLQVISDIFFKLTYLYLPSHFKKRFLQVGNVNSKKWIIQAPTLLKLVSPASQDPKTKFLILTSIEECDYSDPKRICLKTIDAVEVIDNLKFIQLAEVDKSFRQATKPKRKKKS